jgi:hypothetical protein
MIVSPGVQVKSIERYALNPDPDDWDRRPYVAVESISIHP